MIITEKYYPLNAFRICADHIDQDVSGRVFSPLWADPILFFGMGQMLVLMDELFDHVGYPQAFQDKRSFDQDRERVNLYRGIPEGEVTPDKIMAQSGKKRTFDVVVMTRRNTSWQGELYDADGIFISSFDGEIELLASIVNLADGNG